MEREEVQASESYLRAILPAIFIQIFICTELHRSKAKTGEKPLHVLLKSPLRFDLVFASGESLWVSKHRFQFSGGAEPLQDLKQRIYIDGWHCFSS